MISASSVIRGVAAVLLALLVWMGQRGAGRLPPLGPLLDPIRGAWGLAFAADLPQHGEAAIRGLERDVRVLYDDRSVPHVFATSELDAWAALGYVTARDRLFQLDLQARAGSGTMTGLLGASVLEPDREVRELGMGRAAERLFAALPKGGETLRSLEAYAAGVNAYLDAMPTRELPLEYRLLGTRPARWSPLRTMQVALRMAYTLAQSDVELDRLRAAARVGDAAAAALFPLHSPLQEPIQPSRGEPRRLPVVLPPPGAPDTAAATLLASVPSSGRSRRPGGNDLGSNNWAVAPGRTRGGAALLAGDPHLDLTLPSIWYEAHIVVPDSLDVYGVTIPGLPAIVIGFNRDLAWSFTNVEADLMDRWAERVDDPEHPRRYMLDGAWIPIETRAEAYVAPRGDTIAIDTLRFTHRGPLRRLGSRWFSLRWTALESTGGETMALHRAARARSVREWLDATATYRSPPQNMLVTDRAGTIAIRSTGRFPIRAGDGRGDRVRDGTTRATDWQGDVAMADYPQSVAPSQGFLASANQEPQDPRDQRQYLGADWPLPWRALRINRLLRADSAVTPETMRRWQTDPGSARADHFVPYLLRAAAAQSGDDELSRAAALLAAWNRSYDAGSEGAVLFEATMGALPPRLWDELPPDITPGGSAVISLLDDPDNRWWDVRTSARIERRDDVLATALRQGYVAMVHQLGQPERGRWRWSLAHRIRIRHLLGLPALSVVDLPVSGGPSTISPSSVSGGGDGASWRMVVELGGVVRAWGTYPGGQSGNPVSRRYDDRISTWQHGELSPLQVPRTPRDLPNAPELRIEAAR